MVKPLNEQELREMPTKKLTEILSRLNGMLICDVASVFRECIERLMSKYESEEELENY